jgi:hypothetical protein
MLKALPLFILLTILSSSISAQNEAELVVEKQVYSIGKANLNDTVFLDINYKNAGSVPLIITQIKSQCSCTTAEYLKTPLLPEKQGVIKFQIVTNTRGKFVKEVYIYSNAYLSPTLIRIKGIVK